MRVCVCSLLRQHVLTRAAAVYCRLHTSSRLSDSNRASLTRVRRQTYARLYPVLLVKQDGSTIHIRYPEPRRMLEVGLPLRCTLGCGSWRAGLQRLLLRGAVGSASMAA